MTTYQDMSAKIMSLQKKLVAGERKIVKGSSDRFEFASGKLTVTVLD